MLRGIATLAMILIHTSYYFLGNPAALFTWKWSQFAVPVFIFCASYLFFQKNKNLTSISFGYFKKRIIRLIYPYIIFLMFFLPLVFLVNPETITGKYITQSILLTGGVSINWLVLLFIYMTIIFPLIAICFNKYKPLFLIYSILSIVSACFFMFYKSPFPNKDIMWLPWSIIPFFTLFFVHNENKKYILIYTSILSGLIFAISYYVLLINDSNLGMYENKYPPTIYFLSFGILMIALLYLLSKYLIMNKIITKILSFFSLYSYSIYFIHYTSLVVLTEWIKPLKLNWITFSLAVLSITVVIQLGINHLKRIKSKSSDIISS